MREFLRFCRVSVRNAVRTPYGRLRKLGAAEPRSLPGTRPPHRDIIADGETGSYTLLIM